MECAYFLGKYKLICAKVSPFPPALKALQNLAWNTWRLARTFLQIDYLLPQWLG